MKESEIQKKYIKYLLTQENLGRLTFARLKNEEQSGDLRLVYKNKALGVKKGAVDLIIYLPKGKILNVEFKQAVGVVSEAQKKHHNYLKQLNHTVLVVYDYNEAELERLESSIKLLIGE